MSDTSDSRQQSNSTPEVVDGLISRLGVIDQQPLDQRASAFAQLHDELRSVLER